jgi:hypothetical protein
LAAELISGLIRGSKYWPLDDLKQMWTKLKVILDLAISNISTETLEIWTDCFSKSFVKFYLLKLIFQSIKLSFEIKEDQDPRRMIFYLNYYKDLMFQVYRELDSSNSENKHKSSFQQVNTLQLFSTFNQFEWKIPKFWSNLLDLFQNNFGSNFKLIREILPS